MIIGVDQTADTLQQGEGTREREREVGGLLQDWDEWQAGGDNTISKEDCLRQCVYSVLSVVLLR